MIVGGSKCAFAGSEHGPCDGRLEWHHAIKQQRLKREFKYGARWSSVLEKWVAADRYSRVNVITFGRSLTLDAILADTRNRVWLCSHHHELVTNGRLKVELPESVYAFADEFGLRAQLENDLARRAA